jgi:phosphate transport system permease protein
MGERSKLMKHFWRGGELFVWMTASGVALSLLMVAGMLGLIMINGLGQFWPGALQETTLKTQETVIGQVVGEEVIPNSVTPDSPDGQRRFRYRVGNRDVFGAEYRWINAADIVTSARPEDLTVVERREWGPAFGRITVGMEGAATGSASGSSWTTVKTLVERANHLRRRIEHLEREEIGSINYRIEKARLARHALTLSGRLDPGDAEKDRRLLDQIAASWNETISPRLRRLSGCTRRPGRRSLFLTLSTGRSVRLSLDQVLAVSRPNGMHWGEKLLAYVHKSVAVCVQLSPVKRTRRAGSSRRFSARFSWSF